MPSKPSSSFASTRNACKLCAPLGACLAYRGVEGCVPFLHGSQGCATYIRRYVISHFKEPMDIASSSFGESAAIFGGGANFQAGLDNVIHQYQPTMVGVASTCLSETIGDDLNLFLYEYRKERKGQALPHIALASTPSYNGTHAEGFVEAVRATVETLAAPGRKRNHINLIAGMVSPADIRHLKEIASDFHLPAVVLPDYSDTFDGGAWEHYEAMPQGGTPIEEIKSMSAAHATIEMASLPGATAGTFLQNHCGVPLQSVGLPLGVVQTDDFMRRLEELTNGQRPDKYIAERGRLVDSYADAHKYIFDKRVVVYGEPELVIALAGFLLEVGAVPVLCATGAKGVKLQERIEANADLRGHKIETIEGADFADIEEHAEPLKPDLILGNSKGAKISRKLNIPLVRIGFPVHDRIGAARLLHIGYRGTQQLFDRVVNALIEYKQDHSDVGYSYM